MTIQLNEKQKENIITKCNHIAGSREITAICIYGAWVCEYADEKTDINVLMILNRFNLRLNTNHEIVDGLNVSILTVNRLDFERDVNRGWLGEFLAEKLTVPYESLKNREYLELNEVKIKKRNVSELLENLVLEFSESSKEMLIRKEYFMYEIITRRAKVFPPFAYSYLNMFRRNLANKNIKAIMNGYQKALEELEKENKIFSSDEYIKISQNYIDYTKKRKNKLPPILKSIQRLALPPFLSVLSESTTFYVQEQRLLNKKSQGVDSTELISRLEDPKKYILFSTPLGLVSLSDKSDISDVVRKILPDGELSKVKIKKIGGVLNEVYIITLTKDGEEQKFVVKKFLDLSSLKWLSLTFWAFGTTSFSVLGQSRLEKEYSINKFLNNKGFPVPRILYISHQKRLIFEEYIEGKELVENIRRIILSNKNEKDFALLKDAGRKIAQAHSLGVSLGDCKPENFIVTKDGVVLLDLEQATRDGNQVWDIAEFLYYSGHYIPPMSRTNVASIIASCFIEGYLEAGGKKENVKKAASARYTKVFTIFTPPNILLAISRICQKKGKTD